MTPAVKASRPSSHSCPIHAQDLHQQRSRATQPVRIIVAGCQAREPQELVDHHLRISAPPTGSW